MSEGTCMVFFRSGAVALDDAARLLAGRGMRVGKQGTELAVQWNGGPVLRIRYASDSRVASEATEISARTPHAGPMSQCNARFEVAIPDLETALDEMNTLMEVQMTLQEATGGYLFCGWNRALTGP